MTAPPQSPTLDGAAVVERLRDLPHGAALIALADEQGGGVELVGGAVRDIMLGRQPQELDVIVSADVEATAQTLAARVKGEVTLHERFGTALVRGPSGCIDLATIRTESYPAPGALPQVRPGTPEQDLMRRDFSANAIAVSIGGERAGEVRAVQGALEDLCGRRLRVLHDQSFIDDPTRILRLVRYAARLEFDVDPHTAELATAAMKGGALQTVSGQRLGAEVRLAFAEPNPLKTLSELDRLGVLGAWEEGVSFDEHIVRTALEIMPPDGSKLVLLATALVLELADRLDQEETEGTMREFINHLQLPSGEGERVFGTAVSAAFITEAVVGADTTAELLELTDGAPVESLALAGAMRDMEDGPNSYGRIVIEEWIRAQRHIALEVTGDDLIAAGVPEGPEVGMRLEESYKLLLEERIAPGRDTELRAALEAKI
ncbi:MAG TPA: hypothetical protein VGI26_07680 [Solirubrobacteraceae bacterium]